MGISSEASPLLLSSPSPLSSRRHRRPSFETGFPLVLSEEAVVPTIVKHPNPVVDDPQVATTAAASPCQWLGRNCAVAFTLLMSAIGAGTLAVPYTFVLLSPVQAMLVLICVGLAMAFTADTLVDVHVTVALDSVSGLQESRETYQHLALRAGGKPLARLTGALTAFAVFGACVGCVRVVKDMAPMILSAVTTGFNQRTPEEQQHDVVVAVWVVVLMVVLPLGCLTKISALRFSSYLGVVFSVYLVVAVAYRAAVGGGEIGDIYRDAFPAAQEKKSSLFWRVSEVVGIYNFTFMLHLNVIPLLAQLVASETALRSGQHGRDIEELGSTESPVAVHLLRAAGRSMRRYLGVAVGACVLLYAIFGICAAKIYGSNTQGNILLNLSHDPIMAVPRLAVLLTILLSFPLLFHPLRSLVLEMYDTFFSRDKNEMEEQDEGPSRIAQAVVTVFLVVAQILCALRVPGLQVVFSFVGASILLMLCYLFPLIFYVRLSSWSSSRNGKTRLIFLVLVAVFATIFCVAATIQLIFP